MDKASPIEFPDSILENQPFEDVDLRYEANNIRRRGWNRFLIFNIGFLFFNLTLLVTTAIRRAVVPMNAQVQVPTAQLPYHDWISPAIEWEVRTYDDIFQVHETDFRGDPRPELDAAWQGMMKDYNIRVPFHWQNTSSPAHKKTEFQDAEGGTYATFSFLHNLHCLNTIRQYITPSYYPDIAELFKPHPPRLTATHMDHCLDVLRQSELCHADMTLLMFEWQEPFRVPQVVEQAPHVCVNQDRLNAFLEDHSVLPFKEMIKHPWTGANPFLDDSL